MESMVETVTRLASHLCGQGRCFVAAGQALPVCQRCTGLYAGAALTLAWLIASGLWRRGLPSRRLVALHVLALLVAGAGGLHLLDLGPRWRLACGLLTGHVLTFWLVGGILCLRPQAATPAWGRHPWHGWPGLQPAAAPAALGLLALGWDWLALVGWRPLTAGLCAGVVTLWGLATAATVALTCRLFGALSAWRRASAWQQTGGGSKVARRTGPYWI